MLYNSKISFILCLLNIIFNYNTHCRYDIQLKFCIIIPCYFGVDFKSKCAKTCKFCDFFVRNCSQEKKMIFLKKYLPISNRCILN